MQVQQLEIKKIFSDEENWNCRHQKLAPIDVQTIVESIRENGLMQPIVVRPYNKDGYEYMMVVGHRRLYSCKLLKWTHIPGTIRDLSEDQARSLNLIENLERKDLNMFQEAQAIKWFRDKGLQLREVAKRVGQSTGWVTTRYLILDLEPDIQLEIAAGFLTQDQIKALHEIPSRQGRIDTVVKIKQAKLRGESLDVAITPKKSVITSDQKAKVVRNMREMFEVQDLITDSVGPNIATRTLAWTSGVISTEELFKSLKEEYPSFNGEPRNVDNG
jgi:ParB family chromosome partitioning protein